MHRTRMFPEPTEPRWYRVECDGGGAPVVLGRVADVFPHASSLTPWIGRARRIGGGEIRLVEEESGRVVARRRPLPP